MAYDLSKVMREQLAEAGITLDKPKSNLRVVQKPVPHAGVDREAVRRTLIERGVDERDLEWMVSSCPSLEAVRTFKPTRKP